MGVINRELHTNIHVRPEAQPKEELLLRQARSRRKGMVNHLKETHWITPPKRASIEKEKDKERHENI